VPPFRRVAWCLYARANTKPSQRAQEDACLKVAVEAKHAQSQQTYGPLHMQPELTAQGFPVGRDRIVRLRREMAGTTDSPVLTAVSPPSRSSLRQLNS
jgi:transposase InsO family protein